MAAQATRQQVNILAISDKVEDLIYSANIRARFGHIGLVLSCGDLPCYYLEYIVSMLDVPLYYVHGNHAPPVEYGATTTRRSPWGTVNLHGRVINHNGLLLAGFEGSRRYNNGPHQYTEAEMRLQVARTVPGLLMNKIRHGRFVDILITHAPPRHIHDQPDRCHQGFEVFRWFLRVFQPRYHLHGHIHVYSNQAVTRTQFGDTVVLNAYGYRELAVATPALVAAPASLAPAEEAAKHNEHRTTRPSRLRSRSPESLLETDRELADPPQQQPASLR